MPISFTPHSPTVATNLLPALPPSPQLLTPRFLSSQSLPRSTQTSYRMLSTFRFHKSPRDDQPPSPRRLRSSPTSTTFRPRTFYPRWRSHSLPLLFQPRFPTRTLFTSTVSSTIARSYWSEFSFRITTLTIEFTRPYACQRVSESCNRGTTVQ